MIRTMAIPTIVYLVPVPWKTATMNPRQNPPKIHVITFIFKIFLSIIWRNDALVISPQCP